MPEKVYKILIMRPMCKKKKKRHDSIPKIWQINIHRYIVISLNYIFKILIFKDSLKKSEREKICKIQGFSHMVD